MSRYWSKLLCSKGGWVTFSANFRGKGRPTNDYWHQKTRVPGISYGVEIFPKIVTACVGCTNVTDDRQSDGTAMAYSELERKFTFAKMYRCARCA